MAEDWIKMRKKLRSDPRVLVAARALKVSPNEVLGALFRLWCMGDDHGGQMSACDADMIDAEVRIDGFCAALPPDWMDLSNGGVVLPDYEVHNGSTAKRRAQDARAKAVRRADPVRKMSAAKRTNVRNVSASNADQRREEKRLTTSPTEASKPPEVTKPVPAGTPVVDPPDSETAVPEPEKPAEKPKPRSEKLAWVDDRYRELVAIVPDVTHAKGRPLIEKLKEATSKACVEQVFAEMRRKGQLVPLSKMWPALTQSCKTAFQAPPVIRPGAGNNEVSQELRRGKDGGTYVPANWLKSANNPVGGPNA
jgi:hypothetical protein